LGEGGLEEEAREPLSDAVLVMGRAMAVERRVPEPASLDEALLPPLSHGWQDALPVLRQFASEPTTSWRPVAEAVNSLLQQ
jgi:hypothetical protein